MARRLFLSSEQLRAGAVTISGPPHHYLGRVLRARVGDPLTLFDGAGRDADAVIVAITGETATLEVGAPRVTAPPARPLTVALALIKGERMDSCIQKLTELGASKIVPVTTERTVVRVTGARAQRRHLRFVDIAIGAARQSHRVYVPDIAAITGLSDFLGTLGDHHERSLRLVLSPHESDERDLRSVIAEQLPTDVCLLVGPEGGFTDEEVERARTHGFRPVSLGPYVLRADTAAVAASAALKFALGQVAG